MDAEQIRPVIKQAIRPIKGWAENRMQVTRREKIIWEELLEALPLEIVDALLDAGFAIIPLGGHVPTAVSVRNYERQYRKGFRATMEMPALAVFTEQIVSEPMASDADFVEQHLPRLMARELLGAFEGRVAEQLHIALATHARKNTPCN